MLEMLTPHGSVIVTPTLDNEITKLTCDLNTDNNAGLCPVPYISTIQAITFHALFCVNDGA